MKTLNPNDLGKKHLVEHCHRIRIDDLLDQYRAKLKEVMIVAQLEILGVPVELTTSKTHYNGIRYWFKCPLCKQRVGVLLQHPVSRAIGCRKCLNLEYKKRRFKGMAECLPI